MYVCYKRPEVSEAENLRTKERSESPRQKERCSFILLLVFLLLMWRPIRVLPTVSQTTIQVPISSYEIMFIGRNVSFGRVFVQRRR